MVSIGGSGAISRRSTYFTGQYIADAGRGIDLRNVARLGRLRCQWVVNGSCVSTVERAGHVILLVVRWVLLCGSLLSSTSALLIRLIEHNLCDALKLRTDIEHPTHGSVLFVSA